MRFNRLALIAIIALLSSVTGARTNEARVTIVYSNSLNGNLDYCRCPSDPRGGLVKRATEIESIRKEFPGALLIDTGDFITIDDDPLLSRHIVEAYRVIGYDALLAGDQEFSGGADFFLALVKGMPFVCANLQVKSGSDWKQAFARSLVIERGGTTIGITGVISPAAFRYYPKKVTGRLRVLDPASAAAAEAVALRKRGAALVILMSHSGLEADLELGEKLEGVDVIVGGHSQTLTPWPRQSGNAVVVQAGANGARIGILELALSGGRARVVNNSFRLPDEHQPADDPRIRRIIDRYNAEVKREMGKTRPK
ncbi:MAG TPA: hypothetical protein VLM75_02110 [Spirochaetota bacterium]|nr:hypothetical protein [Spirochaetota bacterium]